MQRLLILLLITAGVALTGFAAVYAVSEATLRDVTYDAPFVYPIPTDKASIEHGRYIARTRGEYLAIAQAIGREEFERIVRTGKGLGNRHLGLMSLVAPDRFPTLTDEDMDALYLHLSSLAEEPVPQAVAWR